MIISETTPAVVTGAASGLGAATVDAMVARGVPVLALDRAPLSRYDGVEQVLPIICDVTQAEPVERAFETARERHGPARVLVNCAGVSGTGQVVRPDGQALSLDRFERVVRINLFGTFNTIRLFAAHAARTEPLDTGERGVIVNTSSVAAYDGLSGGSGYSASKGGVAAMSLPLAREFSRFAIRVVDIAPGLFLTGLTVDFPEDTIANLAAEAPFPSRPGDPAEFADLALSIVGNPMINGTSIRLDGAVRPREPDREPDR